MTGSAKRSSFWSFRDGPKDQTRNLEIPGSLVSLAPRNDDIEESGLLRRSAPRNDGQKGCNGFVSLMQFSNSPTVIASGAKRSSLVAAMKNLDCFVANAPRNDVAPPSRDA